MDREAVLQLHRNAQRLLRPLAVVNPFASELAFPDHRARARRDHRKYLGLIEAITLLHQHQRPVNTAEQNGVVVEYIEVTKDDLAVADPPRSEAREARRDEEQGRGGRGRKGRATGRARSRAG